MSRYVFTVCLLLGVWRADLVRAQEPAREPARDTEVPVLERPPSSLANLPPWPGPMPATFPSAAAYEAELRTRLYTVELRKEGLITLGRPPEARTRKIAGWVTVGAGLTVGMIGYLGAMEVEHDELFFRAMVAAGLVGAATCLAGFTILLTAPRNPHRYEIRDLHREGRRLESELRRLRWEPFQAQINLSQRGLDLTVRF